MRKPPIVTLDTLLSHQRGFHFSYSLPLLTSYSTGGHACIWMCVCFMRRAMKLLPDHVGTSESADPDLMDLAGVDIDDAAHAVGLLLRALVLGEHYRELAR